MTSSVRTRSVRSGVRVASLAAWLVAAVWLAPPAHAQKAAWAKEAGQHRAEQRTLKTAKGVEIQAEEGWIAVPERRGVPKSRLIEVHYLRLRSRAASPRAPLVYLAGGPGSPGVSDSPNTLAFWAPFLEVGDVVLFDQRGVRDPDLDWSWDGPLPLDFFRDAAFARAHAVETSRRAAAAIRARGVDLAGYQTVESAEDLESLRTVLGANRIALLAFSYGTHLACAYLRRHDAHVENAVLIGTEGPDHTWKPPISLDTQMRRVAALAAADPRLRERIPDLMALLDRVDQKLAREPMRVTIGTPDGKPATLPVGPFGLRLILRIDAGDASDLPVFPRLLWSIDQGDASILTWFVNKRAPIAIQVSGMSYATDAASGWTIGRRALIQEQMKSSRFADVVNFPFPDIVPAWGVPDLGDAFRAPLVSSARTLFLSGELDWNTPPYQAEEIKWGFANATHLVVPNAGHEQIFFQNDQTIPVIVDFLAGQDVKHRRIDHPPLRFAPLDGDDPQVRHPALSR
jgi:pimeloyl-ACP methyl ester carboxylesterase